MQPIYFDNAATTALDPRVLEKMKAHMDKEFGNPSSIYSIGRQARLDVEEARKSIAHSLSAKAAEVFFTSGGTESTNTALFGIVRDLGVKNIISSPIEHHASLHCLEALESYHGVQLHWVEHLPNGNVDLVHLEALLKAQNGNACVSLMSANNETGNLLDLERVSSLCTQHEVLFHSDMVQAVGHYKIDLSKINVDFASISGHKFHGPKGSGVLYIKSGNKIKPLIAGGSQERNQRAGTENVTGIIGIAAALELALESLEEDAQYIQSLKTYAIEKFTSDIDDVSFNGDMQGPSLYTVLSVSLPKNSKTEMLQMHLDMQGICVSGGSACSSGALGGSHVINHLRTDEQVPLRISFCKKNTQKELDVLLSTIKTFLQS